MKTYKNSSGLPGTLIVQVCAWLVMGFTLVGYSQAQDLVVQNAMLNVSSANTGASVTASADVCNIGTITTINTKLGYYWSLDTVLDGSDTLLDDDVVGSLGPSICSAESDGFTITASPGNYYVLLVADYEGVEAESNEGNNLVALLITVTLPDLVIQNATFDAQQSVLSFNIANIGDGPSGYSFNGVYASDDNVLDGSDTFLGGVDDNGVGPGSSNAHGLTIQVPAGMTEGYLFIVADDQTHVSESNENNNSENVSFTLGSGCSAASITLVPEFAAVVPGQSFNLDVVVGDASCPVNGLFGLGGEIAYDANQLGFNTGSLAAGPFLDDGTMLSPFEQDLGGTLAFSLTRSGTGGATGFGAVATMTLTVDASAAPGQINLSLSDILAVDPDGNVIDLTVSGGSLAIGGVWPGDTDNNCSVEAADLLPIGLRIGTAGPARPGGFDISWGAKTYVPWANSSDSFIDATGDGEIDQNDVLPIGVNFSETHAESTGCTPPTALASKSNSQLTYTVEPQPVGTQFQVQVNLIEPTGGLVGIAIRLAVDPALLSIRSVGAGTFLNDGDLLQFVRLDGETGIGEAAFSRKGADRAISGTGQIAIIELEVLAEMGDATELALSDIKLSTAAAGVYSAPQAVEMTGAISTATEGVAVPEAFTLSPNYPNPFNPATTIRFAVPEWAPVRLVVYDVLGRQVRVLVDGMRAAGRHEVVFEAVDLASGTYFYSLDTPKGNFVQTMLLMK